MLPTSHQLVCRGKDEQANNQQMEFDLFGDFNWIPAEADKTDFYQRDQNWTNRKILSDSLQAMTSLARETRTPSANDEL